MQILKNTHYLWAVYVLLIILSLWVLPIIDRAEKSHKGGATQWTTSLLTRVFFYVDIPAAAKTAPGDIIKRQDRARRNKRSYQSLKLTAKNPPENIPDLRLTAMIDGHEYSEQLASGGVEIGPLEPGKKEARLWIQRDRSGFLAFGRDDFTRDAVVLFADLAAGKPTSISLERLHDPQTAQASATGNVVRVTLALTDYNPEANSGKDADPSTPQKISFMTNYRVRHSDSVSFSSGDTTDHYVTESQKKYTTVIVVSNSDPQDFLRCIRTDTNEAIGAYSEPVKAFAATVNKSVPLQIVISDAERHSTTHYRIYAITGDRDRSKELLMTVAENSAKDRDEPGMFIADPEARLAWLIDNLILSIKDEDAESIDGPGRDMLLNIAKQRK